MAEDNGSNEALTDALAPFVNIGGGDAVVVIPKEIVEKLKSKTTDLRGIPKEVFDQVDTVAVSRHLYTAALVRYLDALLRPVSSFSERVVQARLGWDFVRHADRNQLSILQIGRTAGDKELAKALQTVRNDIARVAEKRAAVLEEEARRRAQSGEEEDGSGAQGALGAKSDGPGQAA